MRCNLQIEGSGAEARGRDPRRRQRLREQGRRGQAGQARQARRHARRPRRRLRRAQLPHARRARVRLLHRGDRRRPARQDQVLLERRLRPPGVHQRPQPHPELRRHGRGRRRALPGRRAGDRLAGDGLLSRRPALQHDGHASATCATRRSATRARWATRSASPTTTSTATRPASPATRCRRPAIPASRPTASRSTTTSSTRTTSTSTPTTRRSSRSSACRSAPGSSTRA